MSDAIQLILLKADLLATMLKMDHKGTMLEVGRSVRRQLQSRGQKVMLTQTRRGGEKVWDSGCMLKVEPTALVRDQIRGVRGRQSKDVADKCVLSNGWMDLLRWELLQEEQGYSTKLRLLGMLRLRCLLEIWVELSRGQLGL